MLLLFLQCGNDRQVQVSHRCLNGQRTNHIGQKVALHTGAFLRGFAS